MHIQNLIDDGLAVKELWEDNVETLIITKKGKSVLQIHVVDYQLDLMNLEQDLGNFYSEIIKRLNDDNIQSIALYGATDTARTFLRYLKNNKFKIVWHTWMS